MCAVRPGTLEAVAGAHVGQSGRAARRRAPSGGTESDTHQGVHVAEMQRRRLVAAAIKVSGDGDMRDASVGSICRRAGVSRRTFYELFEDREACLAAAVADALARLAQELAPVYEGEGSWRERVRAALGAVLERFDADPVLARLCVVETLRAGPVVLELRARALATLAAAIDEGRGETSSPVPPLAAQGVVGGALAIVHSQLLERPSAALVELTGALAAMIVQPYLGAASAEEELSRPVARLAAGAAEHQPADPFKGLSVRLTYRTARVLAAIAAEPGASNREIGAGAGIADEGQASRLLARLRDAGLVVNGRDSGAKGAPNVWSLTDRGVAIQATLAG